jgi:hypothetical protein
MNKKSLENVTLILILSNTLVIQYQINKRSMISSYLDVMSLSPLVSRPSFIHQIRHQSSPLFYCYFVYFENFAKHRWINENYLLLNICSTCFLRQAISIYIF